MSEEYLISAEGLALPSTLPADFNPGGWTEEQRDLLQMILLHHQQEGNFNFMSRAEVLRPIRASMRVGMYTPAIQPHWDFAEGLDHPPSNRWEFGVDLPGIPAFTWAMDLAQSGWLETAGEFDLASLEVRATPQLVRAFMVLPLD